MNEKSRIANSTRNMFYGFLSQIIVLVVNFVVRIFFIKYLGETYLGVNGLFSNILSVLSLAEMGFGTAMTYNLYKPLSNNDEDKILSLMKFYARVYQYIGIFVGIAGLLILPFLTMIINDAKGIDNIHIIYLMFLADSVVSYFFAYRRSILNADQKAYVCSQYRFIFVIVKSIIQIAIIILFQNFLLYLFIQICCTFCENVFISKKVLQIYPYLKNKDFTPLSKNNINLIKEDVKALVLSKVAGVALNGTDNIIISAFTSVKNVGILSNYTLISGSLTMVVSQIGSALTGSLGNYIASESTEKHYDLFKKIDFMYFNIYAFCFICMFILYNPFISVFFGEKYTFQLSIVLVFCLNYFIEGMLQSLWTFRTTMGLFVQGKYRPIFAAGINIVVSVILAKQIGVIGVLLGTTFSRVFVNAWYDPYIIFKHGLKMSPKKYYFNYFIRFIQVILITLFISIIKTYFFPTHFSILWFILLLIFTVVISFIGLIVPNIKSKELRYFIDIFKSFVLIRFRQ